MFWKKKTDKVIEFREGLFINQDVILFEIIVYSSERKKIKKDLFPIYSFDLIFIKDIAVIDAMAEIIAASIKAK